MDDLVLLIVTIVVCSGVYFGGRSYAKKLYIETGYYAYGVLNLFLAAVAALTIVSMVATVIAGPRKGGATGSEIMMTAVVAVASSAILMKCNLKLKNPAHIAIMTILQVLAGPAAFVLLIIGIALKVLLKIDIMGMGAPKQYEAMETAHREREQAQYQQEQYQKGLNMGRESTPYDSIPGGLSKDAKKGYQDGQR